MKLRRAVHIATLFVMVLLWFAGEVGVAQTQPQQSAQAQTSQPPSQAQTTAGGLPVIKAETRLVLVDAIVTDKKGSYIGDLAQKDFRVWEDNAEQPIKTFSFETSASDSQSQARYLVLFFDNSNMNGADQVRAREAAGHFLQANAGPNRYIAILDFGGMVKVTQNFTTDAERLQQVVRGVKFSSVSANPEPVQVASLGASRMLSAQADFGARTLLLGIRSVAKNLASIPGRKSLVLLTSGFSMTRDSESELLAVINACNRANVAVYPIDVRGLTTGVSAASPSPGAARLVMPRDSGLPRLITASFHYSADLVAVLKEKEDRSGGGGRVPPPTHPPPTRPPPTVGPPPGGGKGGGGTRGGGGRYYPTPTRRPQPRDIVPVFPSSATNNQQVLYALAEGTSGFVIHNSNDLLGGLDKIAKEGGEYYVLGYTPPPSDEGSCHTLRVRVERSGTVVRSRSGYCNVKPANPLAGRPVEKQLEERASGAAAGNIPASMLAPYFYASPNTARVDLAVEILPGAMNFTKQKGKFRAAIDVLGLAYKPDGTLGARFSDTVSLDFDNKKDAEVFNKKPLHYNHQFEAAPGNYNLKVVFTSGGESFGKLEIPLVIEPYDGKQIAISTVAFSKDVYPVSQSGQEFDAALLEDRMPLVSRGFEFVPSGSEHFKKSEPGAFYVEIYDPRLLEPNPPKLAIQVKVIDRKTGTAKADASGAAPEVKAGNPVVAIGLKLPLETLPPGAYRLELRATDSRGNAAPARNADFQVE